MSFTIIGVLTGLASHWLVYRWARSVWPRIARHRVKLAVAVALVLLAQPLTRRLVNATHAPWAASVHTLVAFELLVVGIASIPIAIIRVVSWLTRRRSVVVAPAATATPASSASALPVASAASTAQPIALPMTRRQIIEGTAGAGFLAATGSMLGWGILRGRHAFEIEEVAVVVRGLPRALDGYTIAQISDVHTGIYIGDRELAEGFDRVRAAKPDLLVVTGDLVDFDPSFADKLSRKLADAAPRDGVFVIPGNHDYYAGAARVLGAMRASGIGVLLNEGRVVRADDGGGFALLGVDDVWATRHRGEGPELARAIDMVPPDRARILLSHQPVTIDRWAGDVALQLSGHTHGGQINPGFRPADFIFRYVAGRYDVRGTTLWVNRGFGTVGPPSRVMAPPEVTRIVLVAA